MRNKETGEFELVVGNGQLLSGFFILVLLLAVTFAMGYVVGQNSPRSARVQGETAAAAVPPETRPQAAAPAQSAAAPPQQQPATDGAAQSAAGDAPPQPTTVAAREPGVAAPAPAPPPAGTASEAPAGSYWQVLAVKESKPANLLADTLKERGYPASVQSGSDGFVRVLVGPYADAQTMGKIKTELETRFGLHPYKK